jgi:hypothetical protein
MLFILLKDVVFRYFPGPVNIRLLSGFIAAAKQNDNFPPGILTT